MGGHLFIFRGIPASGKSSIASAMLAAGLLDVVVCRDDIRQELEPGRRFVDRARMTSVDTAFEKRVLGLRDERIIEGLIAGRRVACADTNLTGGALRGLTMLAGHLGARVTLITIDAPVDECVERDAWRERPVGEVVVRRMHDEWSWSRR